MKKFSNSFKNILGALEAPITFSLVLAFFEGIMEIFEVNSFLFLDRTEIIFISSYLLLFLYFFPKYKKLSNNENKSNMRLELSKIFKCLIIGGLFSIVFNICIQYFFNIILKQDIVTTTAGMRFSIIYLLIVCILGPCIEELCYRGMMFRTLDKKFSLKSIVLFSSLIFALSHYSSFGNVLYAFILGVFMMLLYVKNKSLLYSIVFHIGANVTSTFMGLFPSPSISNMIIYLFILFLSTCICIFMLIKNKKVFL